MHWIRYEEVTKLLMSARNRESADAQQCAKKVEDIFDSLMVMVIEMYNESTN